MQREKEEHRKRIEALDLSIKRHQAAMAEVMNLQEQIQKLQVSSQQPSQQYEEALVFEMIQENLRRRPTPQRAQSNLSNYANETENSHNTRPSCTAKLRPLSILDQATSDETAVTQSRGLTSTRNPAISRGRFPISTGPSSTRLGSAVSSRRTSTISSSQTPSSDVSTALTPGNPTSQPRPASGHSCMAQNVNTAVKKGVKRLTHKLSNLSNCGREENNNTAQPGPSQLAPALPELEVHVPLRRQMSGIPNYVENRNTGHSDQTFDSGYGPSFECERLPKAPPPDSRYSLEGECFSISLRLFYLHFRSRLCCSGLFCSRLFIPSTKTPRSLRLSSSFINSPAFPACPRHIVFIFAFSFAYSRRRSFTEPCTIPFFLACLFVCCGLTAFTAKGECIWRFRRLFCLFIRIWGVSRCAKIRGASNFILVL